MERDNFACRSCHSKEKTLNVHHGYYARGADPWDYPDDALTTQCEECHEEISELMKLIGRHGTRVEQLRSTAMVMMAQACCWEIGVSSAGGEGLGAFARLIEMARRSIEAEKAGDLATAVELSEQLPAAAFYVIEYIQQFVRETRETISTPPA